MCIALILWFLSIAYLPVRYLFWDNVHIVNNGNLQSTISLPIRYPEKVREKLIKNGFPEGLINSIPFSSLTRKDQIGSVLITVRNGTIEFEIINSQDWTLISSYICGGYIALFAIIIVVLAIGKKSGNTKSIKYNSVNINYDSLLMTDINKEIMFVDNIKQAETIIEHKIY